MRKLALAVFGWLCRPWAWDLRMSFQTAPPPPCSPYNTASGGGAFNRYKEAKMAEQLRSELCLVEFVADLRDGKGLRQLSLAQPFDHNVGAYVFTNPHDGTSLFKIFPDGGILIPPGPNTVSSVHPTDMVVPSPPSPPGDEAIYLDATDAIEKYGSWQQWDDVDGVHGEAPWRATGSHSWIRWQAELPEGRYGVSVAYNSKGHPAHSVPHEFFNGGGSWKFLVDQSLYAGVWQRLFEMDHPGGLVSVRIQGTDEMREDDPTKRRIAIADAVSFERLDAPVPLWSEWAAGEGKAMLEDNAEAMRVLLYNTSMVSYVAGQASVTEVGHD